MFLSGNLNVFLPNTSGNHERSVFMQFVIFLFVIHILASRALDNFTACM